MKENIKYVDNKCHCWLQLYGLRLLPHDPLTPTPQAWDQTAAEQNW